MDWFSNIYDYCNSNLGTCPMKNKKTFPVENETRSLSSITQDEWINFKWTEVTCYGDPERYFLKGYERTPPEKAQMIKDMMAELPTQWATEEDDVTDTVEEHTYIAPEDKVIASYDAVLDVLKNFQWKVFTWKDHRVETLMDVQTAQVLKVVYEAQSKPEVKEKIKRMIAASPHQFDKIVAESWRCVSER